jgi:hypothetical protein
MLSDLDILLNNTAAASVGVAALQKVLVKIGVRLLIDLTAVFILVRLVYFSVYRKKELFFTYFAFNVVIFLICFLLNKVDLSMGAAFGLFAVFSMLRYRTEDIDLKDMTYLFLVIAMGLISAVARLKDVPLNLEYLFLCIINGFLVLIAWVLESRWFSKQEQIKVIFYDNVTLIHKDKEPELIEDIRNRIGINIHRVEILKIDFLRDSATIKVFYYLK